jgi:hypothetical protein
VLGHCDVGGVSQEGVPVVQQVHISNVIDDGQWGGEPKNFETLFRYHEVFVHVGNKKSTVL